MEIDPTTRYRKTSKDVHERSIAGIAVILESTWVDPVVFNEALTLVWSCLEVSGSAAEISGDLEQVFGLDVQKDVCAALIKLVDLGLIEIAG